MTSIVDIVRQHAHTQPSKVAATFLSARGQETDQHTYAELDTFSQAIAAQLQSVTEVGQRALLLYPASLDFIRGFMGCQYAGVVAVPVSMPQQGAQLERVEHVIKDAGISVILTTSQLSEQITQWRDSLKTEQNIHVIATDTIAAEQAERWQVFSPQPDDITFLQYTSGSTGNPKGVVVSHANLLHNSQLICERFGHTKDTPIASWLPFYHDMGLIGYILQACYVGTHFIMMAPNSFIKRPLQWLKTVDIYRVYNTGGPNFAYEHCLNKITPEQLAGLDLSSWRIATNGAEPVRHETMEKFYQRFKDAGFRYDTFNPCYGMAETTLYVSGHNPEGKIRHITLDAQALEAGHVKASDGQGEQLVSVSCGYFDGQQVAIICPQTGHILAEDQVGEICVQGGSVAQGYWGNLQATEETFTQSADDKSVWLKTGDLGFINQGELFVTGRLKDLILINGRNIYPQDIEFHIKACDANFGKCFGAAFSVAAEHSEEIVLIQEVDNQVRDEQVLAQLCEKIRDELSRTFNAPVHEIVLIKRGTIDRTTSGKIQRKKNAQQWRDGTLTVLHRWSAQTYLNQVA